MIADNIRALKDVWFIGDHLIRNAFPYLQQLQQEHDTGRENYLHSHYDTYVFYPNFTETNVLTMIRNGFVERLNRRLKLPNDPVIIITTDQLLIEDPLYLPSEVDHKLKWILRELDAAIKVRKSSLPTKAYTFGEPRIMWVRAFQNTRANYISDEIMLKFNNMLRKTCMAKAVYTIPTVGYDSAIARCFNYDGKTQIKEAFDTLWHDIINGIKRHDESDKQAEIANVLHKHNANNNRSGSSRQYSNNHHRSNSSFSRTHCRERSRSCRHRREHSDQDYSVHNPTDHHPRDHRDKHRHRERSEHSAPRN